MAMAFFARQGTANGRLQPGDYLIWDREGWLVCRPAHLDSGELATLYEDGHLESLDPTPDVHSLEAARLHRRLAVLPGGARSGQPVSEQPHDDPTPRLRLL